MGGMSDYLPIHAWVAVLTLAAVAAVPFFLPPSFGTAVGLTSGEYVLAIGGLELAAALGIAAIVIYYHDFEREPEKWQYDP
jgi:hypothetical protein